MHPYYICKQDIPTIHGPHSHTLYRIEYILSCHSSPYAFLTLHSICIPHLNLKKTLVLFFNDLLVEVQEAGFGVQLNSGKCIGDFVDISNLSENVVHKYCNTGGRRLMWLSNVVLPVHPCLGATISVTAHVKLSSYQQLF